MLYPLFLYFVLFYFHYDVLLSLYIYILHLFPKKNTWHLCCAWKKWTCILCSFFVICFSSTLIIMYYCPFLKIYFAPIKQNKNMYPHSWHLCCTWKILCTCSPASSFLFFLSFFFFFFYASHSQAASSLSNQATFGRSVGQALNFSEGLSALQFLEWSLFQVLFLFRSLFLFFFLSSFCFLSSCTRN